MNERIRIFTIPDYARILGLNGSGLQVIAHPLLRLGKMFVEEGNEKDICILPYVSAYKEVIDIFRQNRKQGPVIFVTRNTINPAILDDLTTFGALLIDLRKERIEFIRYLLMFLVETLRTRQLQKKYEIKTDDEDIPEVDMDTEQAIRAAVAKVQNALKEAVGLPDRLSPHLLVERKKFQDAHFTFNFDVVNLDDGQKLPLHCMARFSHVERMAAPSNHYRLFFTDIYPSFSHHILHEMAAFTTSQTLSEVLLEPSNMPSYVVQFVLKMDDVQRTCFMLPLLTENNKLAFVPLTDFFLQKRQYLRVTPPANNPMKARVSSPLHPTQEVVIADVSENGVSFFSTFFLPLNSEVYLSLEWADTSVVCRGITRSCVKGDSPGTDKVGIEIFPHRKELEKLEMYIFNCQINIYKALRNNR